MRVGMFKWIGGWSLLGFFGLGLSSCTEIPVPQLPDSLKVPSGYKILHKELGIGAQIYGCKARADDPTKFEWTFKAPEANLYDDITGEQTGTHYAGPTWKANDGSKVVAKQPAKASAPAPEVNAIPWLLLEAKSNEGNGIFSKVAYIQRLHTAGGKAPTEGCDLTHVDAEARVPYAAHYYFYEKRQ